MFDMRTVDYFLAIVARKSMRAAAQQLGVTQPALTKAIKRLEDSFGAPLFERQARGVTPTAYGLAVLRHARDLKSALVAAREEVAALKTGSLGLVKIGAGPSWQETILPQAITELRDARPGVRVHITGGGDDQLKEQLKSGALDFVLAAVPEAPRLDPQLAWRPLMADQYIIIADVNHPLRRKSDVRPEDLLGYPWVLPPATAYMVGRLHHQLRAAGLPAPVPSIETDVIALKLELMRNSGYLSYHAEAHLRGSGERFIQPLEVPGMRTLRHAGLIHRHGIELSPAANALVDILGRYSAEAKTGHLRHPLSRG
jgi:DNA-binding transcriptional LysR family regulator